MRPLTENVGILCENMKTEDRGIDFAAVYTNGKHEYSLLQS